MMNPENPYEYKCGCHYPFKEVMVGEVMTCECPPGYEYNPNAESQEVQRLTCYSLCDFPETNPCTEDMGEISVV